MTRPTRAATPLPSTLQACAPAVQVIVNLEETYARRIEQTDFLSTNLAAIDWQVLQNFLLQPDSADKEQPAQMLKNKLMNALCQLNPLPADLGQTLAEMYRDISQDDVIRDYALQHLVEYYEQMELTGMDDSGARYLVQSTLFEALRDAAHPMAGTALLGLEHLSQDRKEFDRDRVAKAALELVGSDTASELVTITAFQVCGQMRIKEAGPVARIIARSGKSAALRISAIAALGTLGDSTDRQWLESIAVGAEARLRLPARQALNQMEKLEAQSAAVNKPKI